VRRDRHLVQRLRIRFPELVPAVNRQKITHTKGSKKLRLDLISGLIDDGCRLTTGHRVYNGAQRTLASRSLNQREDGIRDDLWIGRIFSLELLDHPTPHLPWGLP